MRHDTDPKKASKLVDEVLSNPKHPFYQQFQWVILDRAHKLIKECDQRNCLGDKISLYAPTPKAKEPKRSAGIALLLGVAYMHKAQDVAGYPIHQGDDSNLWVPFFEAHQQVVEAIPNRPKEKDLDDGGIYHKHSIHFGRNFHHYCKITFLRELHPCCQPFYGMSTEVEAFPAPDLGLAELLGSDNSASKEAIKQSETIIKKHEAFKQEGII